MAVAYLNDGATSLAAANWSDGTGFANGAELVISDITSTISGALDQSGNTIDYLHIRGGAPRFSGLVTIEFDAATANAPALLWQCGGAIRLAIESGTNDCDNAVIDGGVFRLESGEIGSYIRVISGTVEFASGSSFGASCVLLVEGGNVVLDSSDTLPTLRQSGGTVTSRSVITTIEQTGGVLNYDAGTAPTTTNLYAGTYRPTRNVGATVNHYAGRFDTTALKRASTITTLNVYGQQLLKANSLLTISATNDFGRNAIAQTGDNLTV